MSMENTTNITVYAPTRKALEEVRDLVQANYPSYFRENASVTEDYLQPDARFALRLDFKDASLARNADGVASQVSGTIKRESGYPVKRLPEIGDQIRLKL